MKKVIERANRIYEQFGNDLDRITESLGLTVLYEKMEGRMKEVYFRGLIVIREDLPQREKRELVAHAIAHDLLHAGNHMAMQKRIYSFGNYHEKQANIFAACLLVPSIEFEAFVKNKPRIDEIANHFQVMEELASLRIKIWKNYEQGITKKRLTRAE
ncbi:MAG: ImmA/IrrE family metallo-endopeptidase [Actinobacteria bacterium]|nr:ImmA/IrrE family metallo-endopeptidase [Actinomycetota bacterium]